MWERMVTVFARVIPALVVMGFAYNLLAGSQSLYNLFELRDDLDASVQREAELTLRNQAATHRLHHLSDDPINVERLVAEEAGFARPGTVLLRFDADLAGVSVVTAAPMAPAQGVGH
jgi:hypothetical protein